MSHRKLAGAMVVLCLLSRAFAAEAADEAAMFRVFLKDGGSLVSFGEIARVGERVVFSMPTSVGANPSLRLVNIPSSRVDWERTTARDYRARRLPRDAPRSTHRAESNHADARAGWPDCRSSVRLAIIQQARKPSPTGRAIITTIAPITVNC